jgi:formylglycine-generating enzyme required for sulfatase activity
MGSDKHYPEEAPAHKVSAGGFWMDRHTVTNRDFRLFVEATGYLTLAERPANEADYPGALPDLLLPSSVVFKNARNRVDLRDPSNWWTDVAGADWLHPRGPRSSIEGLEDHPVVHVAFEDAQAYAAWIGKELPTEAEGEFAACGGLAAAEFVWGDECLMASQWRIHGKASSPGKTCWKTGTSGRRQSVLSLPTAMASTKWPAMCGNGRRTGIKTTSSSKGRAARLTIRAVPSAR